MVAAIQPSKTFDLAIIGGGATGLGLALDATLRGFSVVLLEAHDFAKGTSSRATKLVHGGVRYLAQGNISLVREALRERTLLLHNAPHLAQALPFVLPGYSWLDIPFYGAGLKLYDALAGKAGLGATRFLSATEGRHLSPNLQALGLKGAVRYWDGQFDDARLAIVLARTAQHHGALLLNYCPVKSLAHTDGKVSGLQAMDLETGQALSVNAKCVVNAAGVWVDDVRQLDHDAKKAAPGQSRMVTPSQGVHLVVDKSFWPGNDALMVPKTHDGRVLFVVPWLGHTLIGTTDTPRTDAPSEPRPLASEVDFILDHAKHYLSRAPGRSDVQSIWVGLRPLANTEGQEASATKSVSREHTVGHSTSGLVTVTGGKWTTYRAMAEDVLAHCFSHDLLAKRPGGKTRNFKLLGAVGSAPSVVAATKAQGLHVYGNEGALVQRLPGANHLIGDGLTEAMVRFAARYEMARTVEDVLARRWRTLFLDARLAAKLAPTVAKLLEEETHIDPQLEAFLGLCDAYCTLPT